MRKGERISRLVLELQGEETDITVSVVALHPCYRAFFQCWNDQRYYEAHDVLEQLWLKTTSDDAQYFKGLIQAAGAFVHLQKQFEHPTHPKHGRRLSPAARLFKLAEKNLTPFGPARHGFDVERFRKMLDHYARLILESNHKINPWSPETAPKLKM